MSFGIPPGAATMVPVNAQIRILADLRPLQASLEKAASVVERMQAEEDDRPVAGQPRAAANKWVPRAKGPSTLARMVVGRNDACPCRSGKKFKKCCA